MSETGYQSVEQPDESERGKSESLPVSVRRREDQGVAEIGVTVEGAFVPLQVLKLGHLDKLVQLAKTRAEAESESDQSS